MQSIPDNIALQVCDLKKHFPIRKGLFRRVKGYVRAVDGVSFAIPEGKTLGLVGESGCGKTTVARLILRAMEPTEGHIFFRNEKGKVIDLAQLESYKLKPVRRHLQMIFQDPFSSLNPRMQVLDIVGEPLRAFGWKRKNREERVRELLDLVGLDPRHMRRYPHSFSGGQRQRIGIARALALNPSFIVADEPVSALDMSVQAQVLNLLDDLQERFNLTYLFIAHDLSVVRYITDQVAVMYVGHLVEMAGTDELYSRPLHPYTSALMTAVPNPDPASQWLEEELQGEVADPSHQFRGCVFADRCSYSIEKCKVTAPGWMDLSRENEEPHWVACHRAEELQLDSII